MTTTQLLAAFKTAKASRKAAPASLYTFRIIWSNGRAYREDLS